MVEDDEAWAYGVRRALLPYGISVRIVQDVRRARCSLLKLRDPLDIVLLDPVVWHGKGDQLLAEIEALPRQPGVVILTSLNEELGVDASSYRVLLVPKNVQPRELASIMRRVAQGCAQETLERFARRFRLTSKETELLDAIASGVAPKAIATSLHCSRQAVYALLTKVTAKTHCTSYQEVVAKLFQFSCHGLGHARWQPSEEPSRET
jgi:DNA-binding NarL/FixJ family response regulator